MSFSTPSDRAARLVDAARDLAERTGSAQFTVAQVAARAGCSLKGFYACFAGKDDLLVALLAAESAVGAQVLAPMVQEDDDPLHGYIAGIFGLATLPRAQGYARVLVHEHRRLAENRPDELDAALAPLVDLLARAVGDTRDARTVFGLILSGLHDVSLGHAEPADTAEYLHGFCRGALAGAAR